MDEFINKQDVIGYLNGYLYSLGEDGTFERGQRRALINTIQDISTVKAADVQPVKHGEWKINSDGYYPYCSVCGTAADQLTKHLTKYCPECGARMDGDKNDRT